MIGCVGNGDGVIGINVDVEMSVGEAAVGIGVSVGKVTACLPQAASRNVNRLVINRNRLIVISNAFLLLASGGQVGMIKIKDARIIFTRDITAKMMSLALEILAGDRFSKRKNHGARFARPTDRDRFVVRSVKEQDGRADVRIEINGRDLHELGWQCVQLVLEIWLERDLVQPFRVSLFIAAHWGG